MKALSASTGTLGVRVVEDEFTLDLIVHKVHLGSNHKEQCLFVNDHSDASLLDHLIQLANLFLLDVVHDISVAIAAPSPHVYLDSINVTTTLISLTQEFLDP